MQNIVHLTSSRFVYQRLTRNAHRVSYSGICGSFAQIFFAFRISILILYSYYTLHLFSEKWNATMSFSKEPFPRLTHRLTVDVLNSEIEQTELSFCSSGEYIECLGVGAI